VELVQHDIH
jgi:predicted RNase H-like nuclease (RuvC/YqgF family)